MGKMSRTMVYLKENRCANGECNFCNMPCEDLIEERTGNVVEIRLSRDSKNPERVCVMQNSASRKVTLRDVVALLRAASKLMEYVILNRIPEDGIAKRFHNALYGVIEEAYKRPKDAEVILDCLDRMLAKEEDEEDGK